jgi:hypothetical protein
MSKLERDKLVECRTSFLRLVLNYVILNKLRNIYSILYLKYFIPKFINVNYRPRTRMYRE